MGAARIRVCTLYLTQASKVLPAARRFQIVNWHSHAILADLQEPLRKRSDTDLGRETVEYTGSACRTTEVTLQTRSV